MTTPASAEATPGAASEPLVRKSLRKKETKTPDVVFEAQSASPEASGMGDVLETEVEEPPLLPRVSPTEESHTTGGTSGSKTPPSAFSWPARQAWEKTDLDYYQRVL